MATANYNREELKFALAELDAGSIVEIKFWAKDAPAFSRKEIFKSSVEDSNADGSHSVSEVFTVVHCIDGSESNFSRFGLIEALTGKRDLWDGDLS